MALFRKRKQLDSETMKNGAKLITLANPQSVISEQFRNIRTNINFMNVDKEVKTIAFTSAMASAGKSTVSANVAITMAQAGKKTILIDADLRRPTLHSTFNVFAVAEEIASRHFIGMARDSGCSISALRTGSWPGRTMKPKFESCPKSKSCA